jgi:hypothetical protein
MLLYHFSEDPTIEVFVPRAPLAKSDAEPLVWAIDAWHQPMYLAPRDCPRALFWPLPTTTPADHERFWSYVSDRMVLAIEAAWLERLRTTQVYRYVLPDDTFESLHDAGMHVSRQTVQPLRVEPLGKLLDELRQAQVELRVCRSLVPLADAIINSSLHFSLIRMRNAQGWVDPALR